MQGHCSDCRQYGSRFEISKSEKHIDHAIFSEYLHGDYSVKKAMFLLRLPPDDVDRILASAVFVRHEQADRPSPVTMRMKTSAELLVGSCDLREAVERWVCPKIRYPGLPKSCICLRFGAPRRTWVPPTCPSYGAHLSRGN